MKPKNSKERRVSFFKFTALFIITVTTILAAVYFNFKVPEKENALLRAQASIVQSEIKFQKGFFNEMQSLKRMIDSLDLPGQNASYQNSLISAKIVELQNEIPVKDSTYLYDMHMSIVQLYVELQTAKDKVNELRDAEGTIKEYKEELEICRTDLKHVERELSIERR
ncbi:type VI secretion system TssO [uncultured Zobellia sp.]|uniref:type VI secretion system TssO n=1 Tax=uncultured Zobellia sp. TaxID=255433 RepID=UPI0025989405|nr:type VI secretion system TssO [uncultured Zobellia sp.]